MDKLNRSQQHILHERAACPRLQQQDKDNHPSCRGAHPGLPAQPHSHTGTNPAVLSPPWCEERGRASAAQCQQDKGIVFPLPREDAPSSTAHPSSSTHLDQAAGASWHLLPPDRLWAGVGLDAPGPATPPHICAKEWLQLLLIQVRHQ